MSGSGAAAGRLLLVACFAIPGIVHGADTVDGYVEELEQLPLREQVDEPAAETPPAADDGIVLGGALRFNYSWNDFNRDIRTRRGDTGLDIFRVNADGSVDGLLLSAEYRFYSYMSTIHHGWVGYDFEDYGRLEAGITQVPFGLLPYASHNFWFGVPYYVGLEDDYDLGVKYRHGGEPWQWQIAFFKNEELGDATDLSRYSYDPVVTDSAANEETNTINARLAHTTSRGAGCGIETGVSGQYGELFNDDTGRSGDQWAAALHLDSRCGRWNPQLEIARYGYDPRNPAGVSDDSITVGAFEAAHQIAAQGTLIVANLAYNVPVRWQSVKMLTCYNDFSMLRKDLDEFDDSYLNTTGCVVQMGPTYTYFDIIRGRNMVFFGDGSLAGDGADRWETRLNINFGYYW